MLSTNIHAFFFPKPGDVHFRWNLSEKYGLLKCKIEGFIWHPLKPIFTSHYTRDRHVGCLFTWSGIGKYHKMCHYFLFSSYHNNKLQLKNKNISTHTRFSSGIYIPHTSWDTWSSGMLCTMATEAVVDCLLWPGRPAVLLKILFLKKKRKNKW